MPRERPSTLAAKYGVGFSRLWVRIDNEKNERFDISIASADQLGGSQKGTKDASASRRGDNRAPQTRVSTFR